MGGSGKKVVRVTSPAYASAAERKSSIIKGNNFSSSALFPVNLVGLEKPADLKGSTT